MLLGLWPAPQTHALLREGARTCAAPCGRVRARALLAAGESKRMDGGLILAAAREASCAAKYETLRSLRFADQVRRACWVGISRATGSFSSIDRCCPICDRRSCRVDLGGWGAPPLALRPARFTGYRGSSRTGIGRRKPFGGLYRTRKSRRKAFGGPYRTRKSRRKALGGPYRTRKSRVKAFSGPYRTRKWRGKAFGGPYRNRK
jgi:hypothetical protein